MKLQIVTGLVLLLVITATGVCAGPETISSAGERFHWETSFGGHGMNGENPHWGTLVPLYKSYDDAPRIPIPVPAAGAATLESALTGRRSIRAFAPQPMPIDRLARILLSADGITGSRGGTEHRTAPSAGALYPIDIYVAVSSITTLEPGIYHFQVSDSSLELIGRGDRQAEVHKAGNEQDVFEEAPATIIITARFDRVTQKYADRGYRYAYIEAGAICQNIYLQATALEMGTVAVGAFNDDAVNKLLAIDGIHEAAILMMPLGMPPE